MTISTAQFNIISHQLIYQKKDKLLNPFFDRSIEEMNDNIEYVKELYPKIFELYSEGFVEKYGKLPPKEWGELS